MKRIGEYTEQGATDWFKRQSVAGLLLRVVAVLFAFSLIFGIVGFVGGWFSEAVKVVSPANVKDQWRFAYDYDASLTSIARQWCTAKQVEDAETNPDYRSQRITQRVAIENNYNAVAAKYNGRLADAFRAKLVKPPDVPNEAPSLSSRTHEFCPAST